MQDPSLGADALLDPDALLVPPLRDRASIRLASARVGFAVGWADEGGPTIRRLGLVLRRASPARPRSIPAQPAAARGRVAQATSPNASSGRPRTCSSSTAARDPRPPFCRVGRPPQRGGPILAGVRGRTRAATRRPRRLCAADVRAQGTFPETAIPSAHSEARPHARLAEPRGCSTVGPVLASLATAWGLSELYGARLATRAPEQAS